MNKYQRIKEIVNILRLKNVANIRELGQRLEVSEMTIRRDLQLLEKDNIVDLIPGGAIFKPQAIGEEEIRYFVPHEEAVHTREKLRIGQRAAQLVEANDTAIIDIGSTTEYVAKFLRDDISVSVLCCTLNVLVELYRKKICHILFTGGYFHPETLMFESPEAIELISRTRADKVFVSAAGIHDELGVTTVHPYELATKRAILSSAKRRILVADSSKFAKTKSVYFADLKDFDTLVTDLGIPDAYRSRVEELGIELLVV